MGKEEPGKIYGLGVPPSTCPYTDNLHGWYTLRVGVLFLLWGSWRSHRAMWTFQLDLQAPLCPLQPFVTSSVAQVLAEVPPATLALPPPPPLTKWFFSGPSLPGLCL